MERTIETHTFADLHLFTYMKFLEMEVGFTEMDRIDRLFTERKRGKKLSSHLRGRTGERKYVYECCLVEGGPALSLYGRMRGMLPDVLENKLYLTELILDRRKPGKVHREGAAIARYASLGILLVRYGAYHPPHIYSRRKKGEGHGRWLR